MPEIVTLEFTKDEVTWVTSKLSGASGAPGVEAIDLRNWLLCFGCALEGIKIRHYLSG